MTLDIHPWFGQKVTILESYGSHSVMAEDASGQVRRIPVTWTSLRPKPAALTLGGRRVRLGPEELRDLSQWVSARQSRSGALGCWEFARSGDACESAEHGEDSSGDTKRSSPLVGQTGPAATGRRAHGRRRGKR